MPGGADRGRWRFPAQPSARQLERPAPPHHRADQPCRRRAARRAVRPRGAGAGAAAVDMPALGRGLAPFDPPEIRHAELAGLALDCLAWGTPSLGAAVPGRAAAGALAAAEALLAELGAIKNGQVSELGRRMVRLGAHPRLAAMMLAAESPGEAALCRRPRRAARGARPRCVWPPPTPRSPAGLEAIAHGHPQADRAALSRIRTGRERLSPPALTPRQPRPATRHGCSPPAFPTASPSAAASQAPSPRRRRGSAKLPPGRPARARPAARHRLARAEDLRPHPPRRPARPRAAAGLAAIAAGHRLDRRQSGPAIRQRARPPHAAGSAPLVLRGPDGAGRRRARRRRAGRPRARDLALLPWSDDARQLQARAAAAPAARSNGARPVGRGARRHHTCLAQAAPARHDQARRPQGPGPARALLLEPSRLGRRRNGWSTTCRGNSPCPAAAPPSTTPAWCRPRRPAPRPSTALRTTPLLAGGRLKLQLALLSPAGRLDRADLGPERLLGGRLERGPQGDARTVSPSMIGRRSRKRREGKQSFFEQKDQKTFVRSLVYCRTQDVTSTT